MGRMLHVSFCANEEQLGSILADISSKVTNLNVNPLNGGEITQEMLVKEFLHSYFLNHPDEVLGKAKICTALERNGFARNSASGALITLKRRGIIEQPTRGSYRLAKKTKKRTKAHGDT